MLSTDRKEFDAQMEILCGAYDKPLWARAEAYWKGLAKMSIIDFARCVEYAVGQNGPEKVPTTHDMWTIWRKLRAERPRAPAPKAAEPTEVWSVWQLKVDSLFLRYLARRRLKEHFAGDLNLSARRKACRDLCAFFEEHEREFGVVPDDLGARFHRAMESSPDSVAYPAGEGRGQ